VVPPKPDISLRELAEGELGDQDGAGRVEPLHHGRGGIEHLVPEEGRSPGGGIARYRQQVLGTPRNAVQRPAILARLDLGVGRRGLAERPLLGRG
jgi:hypothetical protein